ncbi:MAG: hypothetical protein D6812_12360, partial [Deltaproteobacteria bacterium]
MKPTRNFFAFHRAAPAPACASHAERRQGAEVREAIRIGRIGSALLHPCPVERLSSPLGGRASLLPTVRYRRCFGHPPASCHAIPLKPIADRSSC